VILLLLHLISNVRSLENLSNDIYDSFLYATRDTGRQDSILIVEIDLASIRALDKWPLDRKIHAKFIETVASYNPRAIGFYMFFSDSTTPESDQYFLKTLSTFPAIIIDTSLGFKDNYDPTFVSKLKNIAYSGHDILPKDTDNVIRNQFLTLNHIPSFAMAVLNIANNEIYSYKFNQKNGHETLAFNNQTFKSDKGTVFIPVNYKHTANTFNTVSYTDIIDHKVPEELLRDKIILVGFTVKGLYDASITPFSRKNKENILGSVTPIMIQAQIIDSLMNSSFIKQTPGLIHYILLLVLIFSMFNLLKSRPIVIQAITSLFFIPFVVLILSFMLLKYYNLWFSPFEFLIGSLLTFIAMAIYLIVTTSSFLDRLITDLTGKSTVNVHIHNKDSVNHKLSNLASMVNIIQTDKNVLDTVLSSINSTIVLFDREGKVIYSNMIQYTGDVLTIQFISESINIDKIIKEIDENKTFKQTIIERDYHYEFMVFPSGKNLFVGVLNDITDMVKMNEMKSNILQMLTHELKSPLTGIVLSSDAIRLTEAKDRQEKYLDQIDEQANFIETMVDDFLSLNRLEITDFEIIREYFSLNTMIKALVKDLELIAAHKHISLHYEDMDQEINIYADQKYLSIAIKNLIDNAIKYSPENKQVKIITETNENSIFIKVKDEGYGISEQDQKELFNKFFRVKAHKHKIQGSGLGLAFVKRIIDLHHGSITVFSQQGNGTEFIIQFEIS
jgi:signal transduction histidine kinase/CHASE2 domain-containing sensor protein